MAPANRASITLYYDVISPFSMFALRMLQRFRKPWDVEVVLKPVYLGGVMVAAGNKPPAQVVNKGRYMFSHDLPMTASFISVPYKYPSVFPVNTIHMMRLLRVIEEQEDPNKLEAVTSLFFEQTWGINAGDVAKAAKPESFGDIIPASLIPAAKLKEYIELSQSTEWKDRVKAEATEQVEKNGAFGFPWMIVKRADGKEARFFGSDRFEIMASFLGVKYDGPFPEGRPKL